MAVPKLHFLPVAKSGMASALIAATYPLVLLADAAFRISHIRIIAHAYFVTMEFNFLQGRYSTFSVVHCGHARQVTRYVFL